MRSFPWITASERYLFLEEGQTHLDISQLDGGSSKLLKMVPGLTLPAPQLLTDYSKAMMLAFYEVYLANNSDYRPYLDAAYSTYLSQKQDFKSYLITGASTDELVEAITKFKQENQLNTSN